MAFKSFQTRPNTIKQPQTKCPNGKMFGHQTMFDVVWSPNICRLSRALGFCSYPVKVRLMCIVLCPIIVQITVLFCPTKKHCTLSHLSIDVKEVLLDEIYQKRVRVFIRGSKHRETDESTRAECFNCFEVFGNPDEARSASF